MSAKKPASRKKRVHTPVTRRPVVKQRPTKGKTVKASQVDIGMKIIVPTRSGPLTGTVLRNSVEDTAGSPTVWIQVRTRKGRVDSTWKPNARVRLV